MGQLGRRWQFGWCEYVEISRALLVHGRRSELRGKPLDLLQLLLTHAETVVPNETLIQLVWGSASRQSLSVAISKLRREFGGGLHDIIQNVSAEGYRMAVPVHVVVSEATAEPVMQMAAGDEIPRNADWLAVARLGGPDEGPVWLARNEISGEQRVYKFAMDGLRLRTLQREETVARMLNRSTSPMSSLRRIDDWNFSEQPYYLAGEYVGLNLLQFSKTAEFEGMSRSQRTALVAILCDSVAAAHAFGVLHNDLKPSNVLVRPLTPAMSGVTASDTTVAQRYAVVLIDFGDSSLLTDALGSTVDEVDQDNIFDALGYSSATIHSEMYRAPELRWAGPLSVEADIYSLGVMLYQTVMGDFDHVPTAGWQEHLDDPFVEAAIARAAHRDPQQRFPTAAAMAEALHTLEERRVLEREREQSRLYMMKVQRDLDRARAARPWVIAALIAMTLGVVASALFYHAAVRERNLVQRENRSLQAMLTFLSEDLLAQSNPGSGVGGSSHAVNLTLSDAIMNAVAQIERRFPQDPLIAGRLHETIADGLRARTQFVEADRQYQLAGEEYRAIDGALSQNAIAVDLKRDATALSGQLPGRVAWAHSDFNAQISLIRQLRHPNPEVLALQDFVESGLMGLESDPAKAIPVLQHAIRIAEGAPGFDPMLLLWIKGRLCGLYVRLEDGPNLQAAAEDRIRDISARFGQDSPMLVSYEIYLQESYFLQGKYKEAIEQADRNYPRFQHLLGDQSQYTLGVLANRASSFAQLGRYSEAVEDDRRLSLLETGNPSGERIRIGAMNDAALFSCRSGQLQSGLEIAQRAMDEAGPGTNFMPGYFNSAKFAVAECMLAQQEAGSHPSRASLQTVRTLLSQVDADAIAKQTGDRGYDALVELAEARVAELEHDRQAASQKLSKVSTFFAQPHVDPYELRQYSRLRARLTPDVTDLASQGTKASAEASHK
jgi:serine/threonine protein kinase/DNA-binding winged helix-turn-helix (wHTH) protein